MSQRGKRNYKPRLNDNQPKKNDEPEQQIVEEMVEDIPSPELQPEIIEEETKSEPKEKVRESLTTKPQIVKPEIVPPTEEWLKDVIDFDAIDQLDELPVIVKEKKPLVKKGVNKNAKTINKDKETAKQQKIELDLLEKQKQYAEQVKQMQEPVENKKAHYIFGRDAETGKPGRINQIEVKEVENIVNPYRSEIIETFITENTRAIARMEVEVEIHEKLRSQELGSQKYEILDRKLTTLRTTLEDLKSRQRILNELN